MHKVIDVVRIKEVVFDLTIRANTILPDDVINRLQWAYTQEESEGGRDVLSLLLENAKVAEHEAKPICQDCGTVTVFIEVGTAITITGGDVEQAIKEGVKEAYFKGSFRTSIVSDPMGDRTNTSTNTPVFIYYQLVEGEGLNISVLLKGGGCENVTKAAMLNPQAGKDGVARFVLDAVKTAGAGSCPPVVVTVGVGATFDHAALQAKKALLRPLGKPSDDEGIAGFEEYMLTSINSLGIGPAGLGGRITALDVLVDESPTHMACLPVVVMINCHALRRAQAYL